MNPGRRRRQIIIQSKTSTIDAGGSVDEAWSNFLSPWASRDDVGGREFRAAGGLMAETTTIWKIRAYDGVTSEKRILLGSLIFEILYVSLIENERTMLIQSRCLGEQASTDAIETFAGDALETFAGDPITTLQP